jgi:hypothetical protein
VFFGKDLEVVEMEGDRAKTIWYKIATKLAGMKLRVADILAGEGKEWDLGEGSSGNGCVPK